MPSFRDVGLLQSLIWGLLLTVVLFVSLFLRIAVEPTTPSGLPWIGRRKEPLSYFRAKIRILLGFKDVLFEAIPYHNQDRAVLCALPIGPPQVIIPPSRLHWVVTQPASVVSQDPLVDAVHKFLGSGMDGDLTLANLLRRELARNDDRIPVVYDEIAATLDERWGAPEEWKEVDLRATLREVNARVANRIFVGLPLCRNKEYLENVMGFTHISGIGTAVFPLVPRLLKSPISAAFKALNRRRMRSCARMLLPIVRQRATDIGREERSSSEKPAASTAESQLPDDLVTWMVRRSLQNGEDAANDDDAQDKIISRLVVANLPAIEASTNALWKSMADLLLLADADNHLSPLKAESEAALRGCEFRPDKQTVGSLVRIDKAIRETLRRESLIGLPRQITAPQGVTLDGTHLPHGTTVCISAVGLHFNEDIYENANEYNPFREDVPATAQDPTATPAAAAAKTTKRTDDTSTARATDSYLSFGFGRRACPGRFLVADQMKLVIAHIFTRYEIEVEREAQAAGMKSMRIRRRPASGTGR